MKIVGSQLIKKMCNLGPLKSPKKSGIFDPEFSPLASTISGRKKVQKIAQFSDRIFRQKKNVFLHSCLIYARELLFRKNVQKIFGENYRKFVGQKSRISGILGPDRTNSGNSGIYPKNRGLRMGKCSKWGGVDPPNPGSQYRGPYTEVLYRSGWPPPGTKWSLPQIPLQKGLFTPQIPDFPGKSGKMTPEKVGVHTQFPPVRGLFGPRKTPKIRDFSRKMAIFSTFLTKSCARDFARNRGFEVSGRKAVLHLKNGAWYFIDPI